MREGEQLRDTINAGMPEQKAIIAENRVLVEWMKQPDFVINDMAEAQRVPPADKEMAQEALYEFRNDSSKSADIVGSNGKSSLKILVEN